EQELEATLLIYVKPPSGDVAKGEFRLPVLGPFAVLEGSSARVVKKAQLPIHLLFPYLHDGIFLSAVFTLPLHERSLLA
ncbi:hypothetical protein L249_1156, partial [Ophiocordyceps polyrhachis-furcata BCC 54312]